MTFYGSSAQAERELLRRFDEQAQGVQHDVTMTFWELVSKWLGVAEITESTRTVYKSQLRYLKDDSLSCKPAVDVTGPDLVEFFERLRTLGVGGRTRQAIWIRLRTACQWATVKTRRLPFNPVLAVDRPKHRAKEVRALEPDEFDRLLHATEADPMMRLFVLLGADQTLTRGEALGLKWGDFKKGAVRVERLSTDARGEGRIRPVKTLKRRRTISLTSRTVQALDAYRRSLLPAIPMPQRYVFSSREMPLTASGFRKRWSKITKAARIEATPHQLRHTAVTEMLEAGIDPELARQRSGHSSTAVLLDTYSHVRSGREDVALAKLEVARSQN